MSILIKGMEMPASCPCKLIGVGYDLYCSFTCGVPARVQEYNECCENGTKPDWCPLEEVSTPHGDLIDREAFRREMDLHYPFDKATQSKHGWEDKAKSAIIMMLAKAPTVIPADKDGET